MRGRGKREQARKASKSSTPPGAEEQRTLAMYNLSNILT
jgi:hypothetical protein